MGVTATDDPDFEAFVVARSAQLRRVAFLILRDWQLAEDAVQTSLVKLYLAWSRVRRRDAIESYARRTVVNTSISMARRPRREVLTDDVPDTAAHEPAVQDGPDLMAALATLSPAQAAVVALRYLDDLPVAEVAELLGISEGTVKSHASRGRAQLRRFLPDPAREGSHD